MSSRWGFYLGHGATASADYRCPTFHAVNSTDHLDEVYIIDNIEKISLAPASRDLICRIFRHPARGHSKKVTAVYARPEQVRTRLRLRAATVLS